MVYVLIRVLALETKDDKIDNHSIKYFSAYLLAVNIHLIQILVKYS